MEKNTSAIKELGENKMSCRLTFGYLLVMCVAIDNRNASTVSVECGYRIVALCRKIINGLCWYRNLVVIISFVQ